MGFYNDCDSEIKKINDTVKELRTNIDNLLDKSEDYYGYDNKDFISKLEEMQIIIYQLNKLSRSLNDISNLIICNFFKVKGDDLKIKYIYKCNHCGEILYNLPKFLENGSYIDFSAKCSNCNGLKPFTLHQIINIKCEDNDDE
jgi:hypothetical protein